MVRYIFDGGLTLGDHESLVEVEGFDHKAHKASRYIFFGTVVIIGILLSILPESLSIGPSWIILVLAVILFVPLFITVLKGNHKITRYIALAILGIITIGLVSSVIFLVVRLYSHTIEAATLFRNATILWISNVSVFSLWYWEVDQGGPVFRQMNRIQPTDFLFPQMISEIKIWADWKPKLMDYFFLAFNTSTAFSPTDTMVMSRRAKLLMMIQGSISLVIIAVLAARAINIA
jgi:hypothetical protein